jgi:hypothetical protein
MVALLDEEIGGIKIMDGAGFTFHVPMIRLAISFASAPLSA